MLLYPAIIVVLSVLLQGSACAAGTVPARGLVGHWTFDAEAGGIATDSSPAARAAQVCGNAQSVRGVTGKAFLGNGLDDYLSVAAADELSFPAATFSVAAWVNAYQLGAQQMIVAKNVCALNQRGWGLMLDRENLFRLYVRRGDWQTVVRTTVPVPGTWHHIAAVVDAGRARLYVNGALEGKAEVGAPLPVTPAPLTIGGVNDSGSLRQLFFGALDEVCLWSRALTEDEVKGRVFEVTDKHEVRQPTVERFPLWEGDVPTEDQVPLLGGIRFSVVKKREPQVDGCDWLHGAALIRHKGTLFTCWGANKGKENTVTEVNLGRRSADDGRTWGPLETIGPGIRDAERQPVEAHSHGVFLEHGGKLWVFLARFGIGEGRFAGLGMEAFSLDEATNAWESRGVVAKGIWPLREPERMTEGNWFVPGCDENWLASVAISHGDDLTKWDVVKIPVQGRIHTEATCWIDDNEITLVMRNHSPRAPGDGYAAVSVSDDYGRTWTPSIESNLPLTGSKPYCGKLSTGQRYLIANTVRHPQRSRAPLTIAVSRPGEKLLCRVFRIRDARRPGAGDEVDKNLCYPHAVEYDGKLYVIYSAGVGSNLNDCELALIPIEALAVE